MKKMEEKLLKERENVRKIAHRLFILSDKLEFNLDLNEIDTYLLSMIDEYDFYVPLIDEEQKNR